MCKNKSFCFWKMFKNKKGFTLTELTVTLSVLSIMTAISIPSYISWLPKHKLQTSTRQIYDDLNLAKIRAVKDNTDAYITFNTVAETYFIFLDDGTLDGTYNAGETIIRNNATLEKDVDMTAAINCDFNNRGLFTAGPAEVVRLTNPTGIIMCINVTAAGGISISTSRDGGATWS